MKKSNLIAASIVMVFVFFAGKAKAQTASPNAFRFDIGLDGGLNTGSGAIFKTTIGATARLQYGVSKNFALTLTSGYYDFMGNSGYKSMGMVPVKLGFKAFLISGFYFSGEAGAGFETQNHTVFVNYINQYSQTSQTTKLILSPGLGYQTRLFDFGIRYESFSGNSNNYGLAGLHIGYRLGR